MSFYYVSSILNTVKESFDLFFILLNSDLAIKGAEGGATGNERRQKKEKKENFLNKRNLFLVLFFKKKYVWCMTASCQILSVDDQAFLIVGVKG